MGCILSPLPRVWREGHPESPERVYDTYRLLREKGFRFIEPEPCGEDLLLAHSRELIESIRNDNLNDPDTPNIPGIYHYARFSAGGALKAMELAVDGEPAFSLMRPPGHHAGRNGRALGVPSLGYCSTQHTLKYIHLAEQITPQKIWYICKITTDVEDAKALREQGFEYVAEFEGKPLRENFFSLFWLRDKWWQDKDYHLVRFERRSFPYGWEARALLKNH
ncbi:hypothetical protein DRN63_03520 [Nanoarchaeota archaeon]|nr:MAG: hypothetical protein DRN63_03520 [Nanoarchaeota archaeon]